MSHSPPLFQSSLPFRQATFGTTPQSIVPELVLLILKHTPGGKRLTQLLKPLISSKPRRRNGEVRDMKGHRFLSDDDKSVHEGW